MARANAEVEIKTHSTIYSGGDVGSAGVWTTKHYDWANNPNTGQPWTWAEVDALQAGIYLASDDGEEDILNAYCTQVYVVVTYTPAGIARPLVGGSLADNSLVGKGLAR